MTQGSPNRCLPVYRGGKGDCYCTISPTQRLQETSVHTAKTAQPSCRLQYTSSCRACAFTSSPRLTSYVTWEPLSFGSPEVLCPCLKPQRSVHVPMYSRCSGSVSLTLPLLSYKQDVGLTLCPGLSWLFRKPRPSLPGSLEMRGPGHGKMGEDPPPTKWHFLRRLSPVCFPAHPWSPW